MPIVSSWSRVDRALAKAKQDLVAAKVEEDYQAIGLYCREIIISLAQAVFDPKRHNSSEPVPSNTDSKRMLELFLQAELKGRSNEELKSYAKACLKLALAVQHRRTATNRDAAIAIESVTALAAIVGLLAARQDDWLTKSRWKNRDNAEWEYTMYLLIYIMEHHPVIKASSIKIGRSNFSERSIDMTVSARGQEAVITFEKHSWWKPATTQNAQHLADELVLRAVSVLPAAETMSF